MHELVRAEKVLSKVKKMGYSDPFVVSIAHLKSTQIMLEEVVECFEIVTKNTEFENSQIIFKEIDIFLQCQSCDEVILVNMDDLRETCPKCHSERLLLIDDDELTILSVDRI